MKKLVCIILTAAVLLGILPLAGCKSHNGNIVDIYTPLPDVTSIVVSVPTDVPEFTPSPTAAPTQVPTEAPTAAPTEVPATGSPEATETPEPTSKPSERPDQSVFDDAVFIGNSLFVGLYGYGIITHGKFLTKVGLNVNTVFTDPADGGSIPIIEELTDSDYRKVIIHLGLNELGWPSYTTYISKFSDLLDAVWERVPGARIFIVGLPPVSKAYSDKATNGVTNDNVNKMNKLLEELCERRGAFFVDVPEELYDSNGYLPANASADGIHMNIEYDRIWADHITRTITDAVS